MYSWIQNSINYKSWFPLVSIFSYRRLQQYSFVVHQAMGTFCCLATSCESHWIFFQMLQIIYELIVLDRRCVHTFNFHDPNSHIKIDLPTLPKKHTARKHNNSTMWSNYDFPSLFVAYFIQFNFSIDPEQDKIFVAALLRYRKRRPIPRKKALASRIDSKNTRVRITATIIFLPTQLVQIGILYGSN
jgi:hypothetical protein